MAQFYLKNPGFKIKTQNRDIDAEKLKSQYIYIPELMFRCEQEIWLKNII